MTPLVPVFSIHRRHSIQFKLGALIILLNTVAFLGFGLSQYWETAVHENRRLAAFASDVAAQLAVNLAAPLWNLDDAQVRRSVKAEMQDAGIQTIIVRNQRQAMFAGHTRGADWAVIDLDTDAPETETSPVIADIINDDRVIGSVAVYVTRRFLRAHLKRVSLRLAGWVLVFDGVVFALLFMSIRRLLVTPLAHLVASANAIAAGDFEREIGIRQRDEIGALAEAFQQMRAAITLVLRDIQTLVRAIRDGNLRVRGNVEMVNGQWRDLVVGINQVLDAFMAPITRIDAMLERVAQGDFIETPLEQCQGDFRTMLERLQQMVAQLAGVVINVKITAHDVAQHSHEMSTVAEQMSEGASYQASATEEASSSIQEMASNIRQTATNARLTEEMAVKSADDARAGKHAVTEIIQAMEVMAERISVIQDIASQTNMLALNASIEAVKAQDYGKGFTVVAASVRDLARESRAAADEMRILVTACVTLSAQAGDVLNRLTPNSKQTAELVQEICAACQEQSHGVEHINGALQQLDSVTQHNAATAEQVAATAETLTAKAEALQKLMSFFTVRETRPAERPPDDVILQWLGSVEKERLVAVLTAALAEQSSAEAEGAAPVFHPPTPSPSSASAGRKPSAVDIQAAATGDDRDREFERY